MKSVRSLDVNDTVEFKTYGQYNDMIMDMMESIDGSLEFLLEYGKNKKGYATLIIKGVKTIDDVPARIKDKVVQVLIDLDCGDLAGQA